MQLSAPGTEEYPAGQLVHADTFVAPTPEAYVPGGQYLHAELPGTEAYVADGQLVHVDMLDAPGTEE